MINNKFRYSIMWALRHFILSCVLCLFLAILVFFIWFPQPFFSISGGLHLFFLVIGVDVVCGPLLTLILIKPSKSRKALCVDIILISIIQLSALGYGLYNFSVGRPIAVVFEKDRFRVISYADLYVPDGKKMPEWIKIISFGKPREFGIRSSQNIEEKIQNVEAALQGVEVSQNPDWWQDYDLSAEEIKKRAKQLDVLLQKHPEDIERIQSAARDAFVNINNNIEIDEILWLPVVSRHSMEWVVFIDPKNAKIIGYLEIDGFK